MAKRKNNTTTRKKIRWDSLLNWMPQIFVQSFAWVLLFLFLMGSGFGIKEMVYADPLLHVRTIRVIPSDTISVSKIESLQKKWIGKSVVQINLRSIARDIEQDHRVLSADVRRQLPDGLEIHVDRRIPFGYVHFGSKGRWAMVSRDAVVLDVVTTPTESLYRIEDEKLGNQAPKLGMQLSRTILSLVKAVDAFSKHAVSRNEKISGVVMLPNDSAMLLLGTLSLKINLNDAAPEQTLNKFQYLLETENRAMIEYVDLRFNRVILKRKTEEKPTLAQNKRKKK